MSAAASFPLGESDPSHWDNALDKLQPQNQTTRLTMTHIRQTATAKSNDLTNHDTFLERKNKNKGIQPMKKDKMVVQKGNAPPPEHTHTTTNK